MSSTCVSSSLCGGFYCLFVRHSEQIDKQAIERVTTDKTQIRIYPNPIASSGTINILFVDAMPGLYQIRLVNTAGQLFYAGQKHSRKAETPQIQLSSMVIPGLYIVQIVNENQELVQSSKLVVR